MSINLSSRQVTSETTFFWPTVVNGRNCHSDKLTRPFMSIRSILSELSKTHINMLRRKKSIIYTNPLAASISLFSPYFPMGFYMFLPFLQPRCPTPRCRRWPVAFPSATATRAASASCSQWPLPPGSRWPLAPPWGRALLL